jgi:hypothetical protein
VRRGDEVDVLHLSAAADLTVGDGHVVAEDAETGERRTLAPGAASAAVLEAARREAEWRSFSARHGIAYVPLDAARTTEDLVLHALTDAGILR